MCVWLFTGDETFGFSHGFGWLVSRPNHTWQVIFRRMGTRGPHEVHTGGTHCRGDCAIEFVHDPALHGARCHLPSQMPVQMPLGLVVYFEAVRHPMSSLKCPSSRVSQFKSIKKKTVWSFEWMILHRMILHRTGFPLTLFQPSLPN